MSLHPAYDALFIKHRIRFHSGGAREWRDDCPECGGKNSLSVHYDDDLAEWRCDNCGWSGSEGLRPARPKPGGNGPARNADDEKRRDFPEDEDEPALAAEPEPEPEPEPESEPEQNLDEGVREDFPDDDETEPGTGTKLELEPEVKPKTRSSGPRVQAIMVKRVGEPKDDPEGATPLPNKGLDFADLAREEMEAQAQGRKPRLRAVKFERLCAKYPALIAEFTDDDEGASALLPSPNLPMAVARLFVEQHCLHDGVLTLRHWRGAWWQWRRSHWSEREEIEVEALLYVFTEYARCHTKEGDIVPWAPNRKKIGDLAKALAAITLLDTDTDQPTWLDGRSTGVIVAVANGLLDVETRELIAHSPQFFNQTSVPFDYDKDAPKPKRWHEFLDALWPDETAAIDVLGEWFGYVISGRTDLHKIFAMVGPTRGGKGVIARILTALVGKKNVAGPTLSSFGTEFGMESLIGKSLGIISDARSASGGKNSSVGSVVVERLLSISGEDGITVARKHKAAWIGKLSARLHIISNELPRLGDASSAIVGRLVLLPTTRSWLDKEDYELEKDLHKELSGILNWSLDGLQRLTENENHFTRFEAADEAIQQMRDLASPVGAFVREKCKLGTSDGDEVSVDALYDAHKTWRAENDYRKIDKGRFGRDLGAACPSVRKVRAKDGNNRYHIYRGIRLCTEKDEAETEPELRFGDDRAAPRQDANGAEPGLSRSRIRELAVWYREQTSRRSNDGSLDQAALDAELRAILREEVASPDQVEPEFQRVVDTALAM